MTATEGLGGYSRLAAALNERYGQSAKPWDRRQIELWARRRTRNAAGEPFPDMVVDVPGAKSRTEHRLHDIRQVIAWAGRGVPKPHGHGFWTPAERQEHYAAEPVGPEQAGAVTVRAFLKTG